MARRTLTASVDSPAETAAAEAWLAANHDALARAPRGRGCGCCVRLWRVEGPRAVLETIPAALATADPEWDRA